MHVTTETAFRIASGSGLSKELLGIHNITCQANTYKVCCSSSLDELKKTLLEVPVVLKHLLRVPQKHILSSPANSNSKARTPTCKNKTVC